LVDPNKGALPVGNQPDWGRSLVQPSKHSAPVGDSTRWGATLVQVIEADAVQHRYVSGQFIQCAARDSYARPWALAGSVQFPHGMANLPNPNGQVSVGLDQWALFLEVTMGVGQAQIVHFIDVRETILAQEAFYATFYNQLFSGNPAQPRTMDTFPFVIGADALVGNTIAIRAVIAARLSPPPIFEAVFPLTLNVIVTPFAAGTEL
jgi:hypothetical protein